jgi:hypothetical protein
MLFGETVAVHCEKRTEQISTLCGAECRVIVVHIVTTRPLSTGCRVICWAWSLNTDGQIHVDAECSTSAITAMAPDLALRLHTLSHVSEREQAHCHARVLHRGQYGVTAQVGTSLQRPWISSIVPSYTRKAALFRPGRQRCVSQRKRTTTTQHSTCAVYVTWETKSIGARYWTWTTMKSVRLCKVGFDRIDISRLGLCVPVQFLFKESFTHYWNWIKIEGAVYDKIALLISRSIWKLPNVHFHRTTFNVGQTHKYRTINIRPTVHALARRIHTTDGISQTTFSCLGVLKTYKSVKIDTFNITVPPDIITTYTKK